MHLEKTHLDDVLILHMDIRKDDRGQFCRLYGIDELKKAGFDSKVSHVNSSKSLKRGTLRGIHFQYPPYAECKIISCISGSIWDLAVDLRPNSKQRFNWFGIKLTPSNGKSLIVPEGFGHACLSLEDNSTIIYVSSEVYSSKYESGIKYDDPLLKIKWPINPSFLSERDKSWGEISKRLDELSNVHKK